MAAITLILKKTLIISWMLDFFIFEFESLAPDFQYTCTVIFWQDKHPKSQRDEFLPNRSVYGTRFKKMKEVWLNSIAIGRNLG